MMGVNQGMLIVSFPSLTSVLDDFREADALAVGVTAYECDEGQDNIQMEFLLFHQ